MGVFLQPFDPSREFVTATAFRAAGVIWSRGYHFKKETVTERVLSLLYSQHKIIYDDDPKAIKLLSRNGGQGKTPRIASMPGQQVADSDEDRKGESSPDAGTELERIERLKTRHGKTDLLALAKDIPGVHKNMNKTELATALVRSGHGDT